jgi:hypothetical protein
MFSTECQCAAIGRNVHPPATRQQNSRRRNPQFILDLKMVVTLSFSRENTMSFSPLTQAMDLIPLSGERPPSHLRSVLIKAGGDDRGHQSHRHVHERVQHTRSLNQGGMRIPAYCITGILSSAKQVVVLVTASGTVYTYKLSHWHQMSRQSTISRKVPLGEGTHELISELRWW